MLISSKKYLQALREGKYLRFLEWPQFIAQQYNKGNAIQDADEIRCLLVFDWLKNEFSIEDAKSVALLFAILVMDSSPIQGNLAYALTCIVSATFQCMVYTSQNLHTPLLQLDDRGSDSILHAIRQIESSMDVLLFNKQLQKQETEFLSWPIDKNKLRDAFHQINAITVLRYRVADYITALDLKDLPNDTLKSTRLDIIRRFALYLNEQMELTSEVTSEVLVYTNAIRKYRPEPFEDEYINSFEPLSFLDTTWRWVSSWGAGFFNLLQTEGEVKPSVIILRPRNP